MCVHVRLALDSSLVCRNGSGYVSGVQGGGGQRELVVSNAFKSLISEWYYGMRLLPRAPVAYPTHTLRHVLLELRGVAYEEDCRIMYRNSVDESEWL